MPETEPHAQSETTILGGKLERATDRPGCESGLCTSSICRHYQDLVGNQRSNRISLIQSLAISHPFPYSSEAAFVLDHIRMHSSPFLCGVCRRSHFPSPVYHCHACQPPPYVHRLGESLAIVVAPQVAWKQSQNIILVLITYLVFLLVQQAL